MRTQVRFNNVVGTLPTQLSPSSVYFLQADPGDNFVTMYVTTVNGVALYVGQIGGGEGGGLLLGESSGTAYRGDRGKVAYEHAGTAGNPHDTALVDCGADANHQTVTAAQKTAWDAKDTTAITVLRNGVATPGNDLNKLYNLILAINAIIGAGVTDGDSVVNTVSELLQIFATYPEGVDVVTTLAGKVNATAIVNTLIETTSGKVLDARQGKALKDLIDALSSGKVATSDVANNLTTTTSGKVLDARQGKALKDITENLYAAGPNAGFIGAKDAAVVFSGLDRIVIEQSAVHVTLAGSPDANGVYTPRGTFNDRIYFGLAGRPFNTDGLSAISFNPSYPRWELKNDDGDILYAASGTDFDPATPAWDEVIGSSPAPHVNQVPSLLRSDYAQLNYDNQIICNDEVHIDASNWKLFVGATLFFLTGAYQVVLDDSVQNTPLWFSIVNCATAVVSINATGKKSSVPGGNAVQARGDADFKAAQIIVQGSNVYLFGDIIND